MEERAPRLDLRSSRSLPRTLYHMGERERKGEGERKEGETEREPECFCDAFALVSLSSDPS